MDWITDLRVIFTVIMFVVFLGIVFWAFSGRRKEDFDKAARMPLEDDEPMNKNRSGK
ncbi:MAG: cbb3-type cytochrome c oxidase subunit 3 [Burkholderiales bacterium]